MVDKSASIYARNGIGRSGSILAITFPASVICFCGLISTFAAMIVLMVRQRQQFSFRREKEVLSYVLRYDSARVHFEHLIIVPVPVSWRSLFMGRRPEVDAIQLRIADRGGVPSA